MATFRWKPPTAAQQVVDFTLEKSTDDGATWVAMTTITNDPTNAGLYNATDGVFFYVDPSPVVGEVVRIAANNSVGQGPFCYLHGPPQPPTLVNLFGSVLDTLSGKPLPDIPVHVIAGDSKKASLIKNAGTSSLHEESAVAVRRRIELATDEAGRWQTTVLAGQKIVVSIPDSGLVSAFRVPDDIEVLNFRDTSKYRIPVPDFADVAGGVGIQVSLP